MTTSVAFVSKNLGDLFEKMNHLIYELESHVGCGCGSSTKRYYEEKIKEVIKQDILQFHHFVCPHCKKSLSDLRVEYNYQI